MTINKFEKYICSKCKIIMIPTKQQMVNKNFICIKCRRSLIKTLNEKLLDEKEKLENQIKELTKNN